MENKFEIFEEYFYYDLLKIFYYCEGQIFKFSLYYEYNLLDLCFLKN